MTEGITLKEVAQRAGVSYQTVSKVLNKQIRVSKETEERIWDAVQQLGYRPNLIARSLRSARSGLIGYTWDPAPPDLTNPILDLFLQSMAQAAEKSGYHLLCFPRSIDQEESLKSYRELIATNRVDGFIVSGIDYNDSRIHLLQELGFPFVAFGRSNPEWDFPYVDLDGADGIRQVTEHFIQLGHTKIATLAWPIGSRVGDDRLSGYYQALQKAGIEVRPEWVKRGEGRFHFAHEAALDLLNRPDNERPTAIVAFEDPMAIGAMGAIQELGLKIGDDIAVAGFDDSPMVEYLTLPLTSVRQPAWEIGQMVIKMLACLLNGEPLSERHVLLRPALIVRASSGHSLFDYRNP